METLHAIKTPHGSIFPCTKCSTWFMDSMQYLDHIKAVHSDKPQEELKVD